MNFDSLKNKIGTLLKKYDYDINQVVGVKGEERYILYADRKLLRIYRGKLKGAPLINTYIPIEFAIFYNFEMEKHLLEKVDLERFIETKVYEETGIDETEQYVIKYKVVDNLKNNKKVIIETVIVSYSFLKSNFTDILEETGYIDYLSFPAFSYRSLYQEKILTLANDMFIVILDDKVFITFYSDGELVKIVTISGGLDKIYKSINKLNIANFNLEVFKRLLTQKGLEPSKYSPKEFIVYRELVKEFNVFSEIIEEQIKRLKDVYNIDMIDRIFITTKYGNVLGLDQHLSRYMKRDTFDFEFYESYNLDRLPIDPLLFLGMLETHYAYKFNDFSYNFSLFLREPTFFYRPSGQFILTITAAVVLFSAYPLYQYINGLIYHKKNNQVNNQIAKLRKEIVTLQLQKNQLESKKKKIKSFIEKLVKEISRDKKLIATVYKFKYSYIPKSQELTDITILFNKNKVYMKSMSYSNNQFLIKIFSYNDKNIAKLIKDLINNGFNVYTDGMKFEKNVYISNIRIEE